MLVVGVRLDNWSKPETCGELTCLKLSVHFRFKWDTPLQHPVDFITPESHTSVNIFLVHTDSLSQISHISKLTSSLRVPNRGGNWGRTLKKKQLIMRTGSILNNASKCCNIDFVLFFIKIADMH